MTEPTVFLRHVRMIRRPGGRKLCTDGIEAWCARYGISMAELSETGIPGERIIEIGDQFAMKALQHAREEESNVGR